MQLEGRRGGIDEEGKKKQHQDIRSSSIKREQSRKVSEDCLLLSGLWAASASCPLRSPWTVASASSAALWLRDTERDEEQHKSDQKHQQWGLNFHTQMSFVSITAVNFVWITFCFCWIWSNHSTCSKKKINSLYSPQTISPPRPASFGKPSLGRKARFSLIMINWQGKKYFLKKKNT